jgi:hypothetical protein
MLVNGVNGRRVTQRRKGAKQKGMNSEEPSLPIDKNFQPFAP